MLRWILTEHRIISRYIQLNHNRPWFFFNLGEKMRTLTNKRWEIQIPRGVSDMPILYDLELSRLPVEGVGQ